MTVTTDTYKLERTLHDSRQSLAGTSTGSIERSLGVLATVLYHHGQKSIMVDIEYETPYLNSNCFGKPYPVNEVDSVIRTDLLTIAAKCNELAAELTSHAERLTMLACEVQMIDGSVLSSYVTAIESNGRATE